jgi:hypothetical protein
MKTFIAVFLCLLTWQVSNAQQLESFEENGKYGIKDATSQKIIVPAKYDEIYAFSEGLAMVGSGGKFGYIDKTGKRGGAYAVHGSRIRFQEGVAGVSDAGVWGFIDKSGNAAIPFEYEEVNSFSEGLALVVKNDNAGFIDKTNKAVIPLVLRLCHAFQPGACRRWKKMVMPASSTSAAITSFPMKYLEIDEFSQGLAPVNKDNKWGLHQPAGSGSDQARI